MTNNAEKAVRYNEGKLQWTLADFKALEPMIKGLEFGAKKYSKDNWKKGLKKEVILDSLLRHIIAITEGEWIDKESGVEHVGLAMCNLMFLSHHKQNNLI